MSIQWIRKAARRVVRGRPRPSLEYMDFYSGLGDSAWLLHGLVRSLKPDVCVEIGSARGKSACFVADALERNGRGHLYAIDPHATTQWNDHQSVDTFPIMTANLQSLNLQHRVTILRQTSEQAAKEWTRPINLIFIDGDHSYEGVKRDWDLFRPFIAPFGFAVFHDTIWDIKPDPQHARSDMGVPRFVEELRQQGYPLLTIDKDCGVTLVQPVKQGMVLSGKVSS